MTRWCISWAAVCVLGSAGHVHADEVVSPGPSFACPAPQDPLAQLICESSDLPRADLVFVQNYQALRQQLAPEQQSILREESLAFGRLVRAQCGFGERIPTVEATAAPATRFGNRNSCVAAAYARQTAIWAARLVGPAAEEARRPLDRHLALQRDLQLLGMLPANQMIDGVYGPTTRAAILAFQQAMGLPTSGLLGDADALVLLRQSHGQPVAATTGMWEGFIAEATALGVRPSVEASANGCAVALDVRNPQLLAKVAREWRRPNVATGDASGGTTNLFASAIQLLQTEFAAKAVHAYYGDRPDADRCSFSVAAFTQDIYGRDVRQSLFSFSFDRATYEKIVWQRFNSDNLPKIVVGFAYGPYAQALLKTPRDAAQASHGAKSQSVPPATETSLFPSDTSEKDP